MLDSILLRIAKTSILQKFSGDFAVPRGAVLKQYPQFKEMGATFVTLKTGGSLRGCIGSVIAHQPLIDDLIQNAQSAAFKDPRFSPLTPDELSTLTIEVSVLTKPQLLIYKDYRDLIQKITPHQDGLILQYRHYKGTFLPQVWEQLPDPHQFLEHLAYKANANPSIYEHRPDIYLYRVEAIEEAFDAIQPL